MASTYRQVGFGSTGSAVSKLQTILNQHGYGLAVDGIFGEKTRAAVRDYQKRYNLKLDGIAGPETWGSLLGQNGSSSNGSYTGGGSSGKTSTSTNLPLGKVSDGTAAALDRLEKGYTPSSDVEAEQALLDSLAQLRPGDYESDFTAQLDALYQEISSRPGFSYDPGSDAAYQSAAQQSYQRYLQQLSDVLPQLQSAAYSRYRDEGDALLDRYKLLQGQDEEAYGHWQDLVSAWQKEVSQAQSRYEQISSRDLKNYQLLLDYFANKAAAEQKGLHTSKTDESALSSIGNTASLSSTAAESLERAMNNYLKSGNAQQADTLLNQYKNRMTPAQKARFEALFAAWNRPLSW